MNFLSKKGIFYKSIFLLLIIASSSIVEAAVPEFINYQSRLRDASDEAITSAITIQFSIYDNDTLGAPEDIASSGGNLLWTERYSQSAGVCKKITPDNDGYFSVQLGICESFPSYLDFSADELYLGVKIEADTEAAPRVQLGTAPYAFNSKLLNGIDASSFLRSDEVDIISALSASTLLTLDQEGSGDILNLLDDGVQVFTIQDGGNVGIGDSSPLALFTVGDGDMFQVNSSGEVTASSITSTGSISVIGTSPFVLEGVTEDDFETTITVTDPTADRNIILPDTDGTIALTSDITTTLSGLTDTNISGLSSGDILIYDGIDSYDNMTLSGYATMNASGVLSITNDIIDFTEIADFLTLDTTTRITTGANDFEVDLNGGGSFNIKDDTTTLFSVNEAGSVSGNSFIKSGGTSTQFLKADGSVDSSSYLTLATLDSDITALANNSNNGLWVRTGTGTGSARTITATTNTGILITNGNGVSGNPTIAGINASTSVKGVASFNSTNFSASSGAINTVQNINTGSSPTFSRLYSGSGTLLLPAYSFSGDTDTGMWSPTADTLAWSTGGNERMVVDQSGNVGIGTTSPINPLSVEGAADMGSLSLGSTPNYTQTRLLKVYDDGGSGGARVSVIGTTGISNKPAIEFVMDGQLSKRSMLRMTDEGSNDYGLDFITTNAGVVGVRMQFTGDGKLGIGTTSPAQKLDVAGNGLFSGSLTANSFIKTGGLSTEFLRADGSVDSSTYLTSYTETDTLATITGRGATTATATSFTGGLTTNTFDIAKPAQTGVRERLMTATVSDNATSNFFINNGTISNGIFAPVFGGYTESTSLWPLGFGGYISAGADASDSSTFGLIDFATFRTTNGADALNGSLSPIQNRKLLTIRNHSAIALTVLADGNVGIGTTSPAQKLDVAGNAKFSAVGSGAYAFDLNLTSDGTLTTSSSDERLKENVLTLDSDDILEKINQLNPSSFEWKSNNSPDIGLIAQEVESVFPGLVFTNPTDGYKGINYSRLSTLAISAIQEVDKRLEVIRGYITETGEGLVAIFKELTVGKLNIDGDVCVDDVCITKEQFKNLLLSTEPEQVNQTQTNTSSESTTTSGTTDSETANEAVTEFSDDNISEDTGISESENLVPVEDSEADVVEIIINEEEVVETTDTQEVIDDTIMDSEPIIEDTETPAPQEELNNV